MPTAPEAEPVEPVARGACRPPRQQGGARGGRGVVNRAASLSAKRAAAVPPWPAPWTTAGPARRASRIETLLTLLALAALLPAFLALASARDDGEGRYAAALLLPAGLPEPVLPALCRQWGLQAEPALRERLCRGLRPGTAAAPGGLPAELGRALGRVRQAFLEPLRQAQARLAALRQQQHEGVGDLLALGHEIEALLSETQPYARRHALDGSQERAPLPLHCAYRRIEAAFLAGPPPAAGADAARGTALANAVLLFGGALDGVGATGALAASALLPASGPPSPPSCPAALADALAEGASLMARARQEGANAAKDEAMRALLRSAGWQWAGWMLLGLGLAKLARRVAAPSAGVALALAAWTLAAWIGRVPWPLAGERAFLPAREAGAWLAPPAGFVIGLFFAAVLLFGWALRRPRSSPPPPQVPASRLGYPGLVLATGVGWVLLLDLSAHAHAANRYLALYHQGHLWLGMLVFSVLLCLRQPLGRSLAWSLSVIDELAAQAGRRLGGRRGRALLLALVLAGVLLGSWALSNLRQLTSELGRLWLIVGAAWFFFLRGAPLAERLAAGAGAAGSLGRYVWPLGAVAAVLLVAMLATRDFGPLLIASYGAGAFLAASVATWRVQRGAAPRPASALAAGLFCAWIVALSAAVLALGHVEDTTAARLESLAAPLASANDQLALVRWFRQATPPGGFGPGQVPWCGFSPAGGCPGVPAQVHSDYTLTAMVGVFGPWAAAAFTLGCALWLHRLVRHHGRVTRGEPRLLRTAAGGVGNDDQAFLSWLCVAWVVLTLCQLAVTVAGNLAVLPLTGVTYPFVSYGLTSLLVNMGFLGLSLNLSLPPGGRHG